MTDTPQSPLGSSWDALTGVANAPTPDQQAAAKLEQDRIQARHKQAMLDAASVFGTEEGKRLLDYLEEEFVKESCLPQAIFQGLEGSSVGILMGVRDGENNMIRRLQSMAKKGAKTNEPA